MTKKVKNIFLIVLDSARKDDFFEIIKKNVFPELNKDFVYYRNCNSIYTNTFLSHYVIFFGDYLNEARHPCFPAQLKNLDYNVISFCNYAVMTGYPIKNLKQKGSRKNLPSLTQMINNLGVVSKFNLKDPLFGNNIEDYYGAADDIKNQIPKKWKEYLIKNKEKNNFMFLHFWKTHHNYGINEFLNENIDKKTYIQAGKELVNKIVKKEITIKIVKKFYYKQIYNSLNTYIRDLIEILKHQGLYDDSLIIITADHGEGLGDFGYNCSKRLFYIYKFLNIMGYRIRSTIYSSFPKLRNIYRCRWDPYVFYHNGGYYFQKQVPLLIKFPQNLFGGTTFNKAITLFDIIHTINEYLNNALEIYSNRGCSLKYLLQEGENAREKYIIKKSIQRSF
ncbi:MAG: sulfatase-like hydrolase/transferase [Promethearchaeota archaeon]